LLSFFFLPPSFFRLRFTPSLITHHWVSGPSSFLLPPFAFNKWACPFVVARLWRDTQMKVESDPASSDGHALAKAIAGYIPDLPAA